MHPSPLDKNYLNFIGAVTKRQKSGFIAQNGKGQRKDSSTARKQRLNAGNVQQYQTRDVLRESHGERKVEARFAIDAHSYSHLQLFSQGYLVCYTTKLGKVSGRATLLFPEGLTVNTNIFEGQLNGWTVLCQKDQYCNISSIKKGLFEGKQYSYDMQQGIMSESIYKNNKLYAMVRCINDTAMTFDKFVANRELTRLLHGTYQGEFFQNRFPRVQSEEGVFYGSVVEGTPWGLGIIKTKEDTFYGEFEGGLLDGRGAMSFDGGCYVGQFQKGEVKGLGSVWTGGNVEYVNNRHTISKESFIHGIGLSSFNDHRVFRKLFDPVVELYGKLKLLYAKGAEEVESEVSLVDIIGAKEVQSDLGEKREVKFDQSFGTSKHHGNKNRKSSLKDTHVTFANELKEPRKDWTRTQNGRARQEARLMQNHEWQEVFEQLQQNSVGREDAFYKPCGERPRHLESLNGGGIRSKDLNVRRTRQDIVRLGQQQASQGWEERGLEHILDQYTN